MTSPTAAATLGVAPAPRHTMPPRVIAIQAPNLSPTTLHNGERSTQSAGPATASAPNTFLASLDELGRRALDGEPVAFAIEQGRTAPDIAARNGIRQSSDAFRTLVCRVENRRIEVLCRSLGL